MEAITTKEKLKSLTGRSVLCFWAEWSMPSKATSNILIQLEKTYKNISYFSVEAEECGEISDSFQVVAVPTVLFLIGDKEVNRLVGANPPELNRLLTEFSKSYNEVDTASTTTQSVQKPNLDERLKELINQHKVMGFIKGTPSQPQCGFSRKFCDILQKQGVQFGTFNILSDQDVREGLKKYSNWPTYPQLYINGELVGGLDIITDLIDSGEFADMLK